LTLIKTSLLNAIAVGLRMLTLLGINKILAVYVGPAGYAAFGQFQNVIQMIITLASGGINTGVTKYTAEYQDNEVQQHKVWQTAGLISLIGSLVISALLLIYSENLALRFLGDPKFKTVFIWFSATLILFVFNTLLLSILNGKKDISRYVLANIFGSVLALCTTAVMVVNWGLLGALIALTLYQSLAFFATLILCLGTTWFSWKNLTGPIDWGVAKNLAKYTAMALTSAATVPISHILIRDHLGQTFGWEAAGYWEAMWRMSGAYLMLATTTLSVYYLPKLSELKNGKEIKNEIISGCRIILPVCIIISLFIYYFRNYIIITLFSDLFLRMEALFFWQLIGDIIKISSWLFAYVMISKSMTVIYITSEIIFCISFYLLVIIFTEKYGLEGAVFAYSLNYLFYLIIISKIITKKLEIKK
jgi:PST family polysaccharide transporter